MDGAALAPGDLDYPASEQGPALSVALSEGGLLITWADSEGYSLESKAGLDAAEWTAVDSGLVTVTDGQASVTLPTSGSVEVFRLRKE